MFTGFWGIDYPHGVSTRFETRHKFLNRVELSAGTHHLFYSYSNQTGSGYTPQPLFSVGLKVWNKDTNSGNLQFRTHNYGYSMSGDPLVSTHASHTMWNMFYNGSNGGENFSLAPNQSKLIYKRPICGDRWFSGIAKFEVSQPCFVAFYAYRRESAVMDNNCSAFPYPDGENSAGYDPRKMYSGYTKGVEFFGNSVIDTPSIRNGQYRYIPMCARTINYGNYRDDGIVINGERRQQTDLLPIQLLNGKTASWIRYGNDGDPVNHPWHNVGNWCIPYHHDLVFRNTSNTPDQVKILVHSPIDIDAIVRYNGSVKHFPIKGSSFTDSREIFSLTVPPSLDWSWLSFTAILGTNSGSPMDIVIKS